MTKTPTVIDDDVFDADDIQFDMGAALREAARLENIHSALGGALGALRALGADPSIISVVQEAFDGSGLANARISSPEQPK